MKNKRIHNIEKTGFKTPDKYFDSFDERIMNSLNANKQMAKVNSSGHAIPDQYLETFDDKLLSKISEQNTPKVVKFMSWKNMAYATGIAAGLILLFGLIFNNTNDISFDALETASIESYLSETDLSSYELASLFSEEELISHSFTDITISESSIEDYLLENASLEDLIIE